MLWPNFSWPFPATLCQFSPYIFYTDSVTKDAGPGCHVQVIRIDLMVGPHGGWPFSSQHVLAETCIDGCKRVTNGCRK